MLKQIFSYKKLTSTVNNKLILRKMHQLSSKIAICHMTSTNDKVENLHNVNTIVKEAKEKSANFVFLPECCDFVGGNRNETLELGETFAGPNMEAYKKLAQSHDIWLSLGGIHESILNSDGCKSNKIYNSHVIINNNGDIVNVYRKLHLFDVHTPDFKFRESDVVAKGKEIIAPFDTPIGKLGLQICYDIRFPECSTILRKQGAEILTYPSAFAYSTGTAHWEVLLRARAIENQCFVIASAQVGWHNKKRQSYGNAMIIDPWGKIIAKCDNDVINDVVVTEINTNSIEKIKQSMPCFEHRRSDIYSLIPIEITKEIHTNDDALLKPYKFGDCVIARNTVFYETDFSFAFTNLRCVVPGHILIASKRVVHRFKDLSSDEISDLFQCVAKIQKILEPIYGCTSSTINIQDGPEAGQTIQHVHVHIMPRKQGDFHHNDLIYVELNRHDHSPSSPERTAEERQEEAAKYRNLLNDNL